MYLQPPEEMNLLEHIVLQMVRPLYRITESGLHWYLTYVEYHVDGLGMECSRADPCILLHRRHGHLDRMIVSQLDDILPCRKSMLHRTIGMKSAHVQLESTEEHRSTMPCIRIQRNYDPAPEIGRNLL